jgi:tetratricopeptide (TPR) repeat protein
MKNLFLPIIAFCSFIIICAHGQNNEASVEGLTISSDNRLLASVKSNGAIAVWQLPEMLPVYSTSNAGDVSYAKPYFSPDSKWCLVTNKTTILIDLATLRHYILPLRNAFFSKDGKSIAGLHMIDDGAACIKKVFFSSPDITSATCEVTVDKKLLEEQLYVHEPKPGSYLYYNYGEGNCHLHNSGEKKPYAKFSVRDPSPLYFIVSKDGKYIIDNYRDVIYDISGVPKLLEEIHLTSTDGVSEVNVSIENDMIYVCDQKEIFEYKLSGGWAENTFKLTALTEKNLSKRNFVLSDDRSTVIFSSYPDHQIYIYEVKTKNLLALKDSKLDIARAFVKANQYDSAVNTLKSGLRGAHKININLIMLDSAFMPLTAHSSWKEIAQGNWYSPYESLVFKGEEYFSIGKMEEAEATYSKAIALDASKDYAYGGRAGVYAIQNKTAEALADCDMCLKINSNNLNCLTKRAELKLASGDKKAAVAAYQKILTLDKTLFPLHFQVAKLTESDDRKLAYEHINNYLDYARYNDEAYALKARLEIADGEKAHAVRSYVNALDASDKEIYYEKIIQLYTELNMTGYAQTYVDRLKIKNSKNTNINTFQQKLNAATNVSGKSQDPTACPACDGHGHQYESVCNVCRGAGARKCIACGGKRFIFNNKGQSSYCTTCSGQGSTVCYKCYGVKASGTAITCKTCGGTGKVK